MATVYRNLQGLHSEEGGDASSSKDLVILDKPRVYDGRGRNINTGVKITSFSISNVSTSGTVTFDLYIKEQLNYVVRGKQREQEGQADAVDASYSTFTRNYNKYYLVKGVVIPEGSSVFPLEHNIIEFDLEHDLVICIKGTENQKADVILTYE